jgi:ribonuclease HI
MFTSYCDASILKGQLYIGYVIINRDKTYSKRFKLGGKSKYLTNNILEFLALEYLTKEIINLQLMEGIIYFDSDFVNRSVTGKSDWFKKRSQIILRSLKIRHIRLECISSKDNLAHEITRKIDKN